MNHFGKWVALCVAIGALAFGTAASGGSEGAKAPAASEPIKVEKAKGADACTVSEAYENAGKLDKKTVVVRGKVVKVSKGIMGKNWVHLRDGSGDAGKGTNNLVVTTQDAPERRGRGDGEGYPPQGQGFRGGVQVPGDRRGGDRQSLSDRPLDPSAPDPGKMKPASLGIRPLTRIFPVLVAALLLFPATRDSLAADSPAGSAPAATDNATGFGQRGGFA